MSGSQAPSDRGRGGKRGGKKGPGVPGMPATSLPPPPPDLYFGPTGGSNSVGAWGTGASSPPAPSEPLDLYFGPTGGSNSVGAWGTGASSPPAPSEPLDLGFGPSGSNPSVNPFVIPWSNSVSNPPPNPPPNPTIGSKKPPAQYPFASLGAGGLPKTGLFSNTNTSGSAVEEILQSEPNLPDTPSKTDQETIAQLQKQVNYALNDENLLKQFQQREKNLRRNQTQAQRKKDLRSLAQPTFRSGLNYMGRKLPGLFNKDGTRNNERPSKGSGRRPRPEAPSGTAPGTAPAGTGRPPTAPGTGNIPTSGTGNNSKKGTTSSSSAGTTGIKRNLGTTQTRADEPKAGKKQKSSSSSGPVSKVTKGGPSTSGGGTTSSKGSNSKRPTSVVTTGGTTSKGTGSSPLRNVITADGLNPGPVTGTGSGSGADPPAPIASGTDGAPWQARNDLFQAGVMDAAGITAATPGEPVAQLPTLPSSIDYNTENWEN